MPCMAHQAEDEPVLKPKSEAYCLPALIHTPALAIITTTLTASAHLWTPPPPRLLHQLGGNPWPKSPQPGCCCCALQATAAGATLQATAAAQDWVDRPPFLSPMVTTTPVAAILATCPHQHIPPLLHRLRGLPWRTGLAAAWLVLVLRPKGLLLRCTRLAGPPVSLSNTLGEGLGLRPNLLGL
jgi:hypothetical protein